MRLLESAVKGVFVQWNSDAPNTKVRSWNVTELRVHLDCVCALNLY